MSDTFVKLKTIADLQSESAKFYIDAYQRGYRWTENEVKDLLEDIREFSHTKQPKDGTFYCLQPIIVTPAEDGTSWKVIDGQQRLTTLYLIYSFYWVIESPFTRDSMPFELSYNNKSKLEECLRSFTEKEYTDVETIEREMVDYEDDIDCHYVLEAYKCICRFFWKLKGALYTKNEINDMKKIFDNHMKIIWYEIKNCDEARQVAIFTKINMGKIPLTNAELIKALLLKRDADVPVAVQMNIAVKWSEMEAQLSEESFWSFLVNKQREELLYMTRIDFIFRVMARKLNEEDLKKADREHPEEEPYMIFEDANRDKFSFYVFSNYIRLLQKHPVDGENAVSNQQSNIERIWDGVCEYYRMFRDWYKNIHWYHMIGFLVETSGKPYIDQILELCRLYKEHSEDSGEGHKIHFERKLRSRIAEVVFKKEIPSRSECRDFICGLEYPVRGNDIRKVLLLYNIACLEAGPEQVRFPFEKYKDKNGFWDIEHINAVSDTRPNDDHSDSEDNSRLQWLKSVLYIPGVENIRTADGRKVQALVPQLIGEKLYLSKYQPGTKDFIQVYEAVINYFGGSGEPDHSIGNLTLLDGGTNRAYKNDVFPLKRKSILQRAMQDVFIPLCTRKVFMKGFAESVDLLRWGDVDKRAYVEEIIDSICTYLQLEENDEQ